jgi:prepilin-type N-terminal cleavage/methylation domain-containing protein
MICHSLPTSFAKQRTTAPRRGFTLIELLVVIAIIAILAAILFPVFAQARHQARKITCASNLKQLSLAILMYSQDYDERFPVHWDNYRRQIWGDVDVEVATAIYPYIKQGITTNSAGLKLGTGIWLCPEDNVEGGPLGYWRQYPGAERRTSYWYNLWLSNAPQAAIKKDITRCILIQDSWIDTHTHEGDVPRAWNVSFADGHTKWTNYGPEPWLSDLLEYSGYNPNKGAISTPDEIIFDGNNL